MGYEKVFEKPYPSGWKDLPNRTTPVIAEIMDDYDSAIENIENFLDGSTAVFPITATGGMTQPVGIDENGRLVTMPSSGGGTAATTSYDNTESGLESTDVQGAIDELAAGAGGSTAATTTYDNTESGLEAENVQDAIDEVTDKIENTVSPNIITAIDTIGEDAQISDTTHYITTNLLENPFACKMLWIVLTNGSTNRTTCVFVDSIPSDGNIVLDAVGIVGNGVATINITTTTVSGVNYSGSFQNLYVDIYGVKEVNSTADDSGLIKLYEAPTSAGITSGTIELSDAYTNYDFLIFSSVRNNSSRQGAGIVVKDDLEYSRINLSVVTIPDAAGAYGVVTVTDSTHFSIYTTTGEYHFYAVYGYKGGGNSSETVLFNTDTALAQGTVIALDESVKNYSEIVIRAHYVTGGIDLCTDCYFRTSVFDYGVSTKYYGCNIYHGGNAAFYFTIDSDGENLTIGGALGGAKILEIIGIS